MKKQHILLLALTLIVTSHQLQAQVNTIPRLDASKEFIKKGTKLEYGIGESTHFNVNITQLSSSGYAFKYQFVESEKEGTVNMSKDAIKKSNNLFNYFSGGEVSLTDQTSVFVSNDLWNQIQAQDTVTVDCGGQIGAVNFQIAHSAKIEAGSKDDTDRLQVPINGVNTYLLNYDILIREEEGQPTYMILIVKNGGRPIILAMKLDFEIAISAIN
jgi:hypothetical protein